MDQTPRNATPAKRASRFARWVALPGDERRFGVVSAAMAAPVLSWFRLRGLQPTLAAIDYVDRRRAPEAHVARVRPTRAEVITRRVLGAMRASQRCLPVALVQYAAHRARREDVAFVVGVRKGTGLDLGGAMGSFDLDAHAWVEDDEDQDGGRGFEPIYRFSRVGVRDPMNGHAR